jgi:hypothetical protein
LICKISEVIERLEKIGENFGDLLCVIPDEVLDMRTRRQLIDAEIRKKVYPSESELAGLLDVSQKTIQRDLALMRTTYGAPLAYHPRLKGWYYTKPYRFPLVLQKERE